MCSFSTTAIKENTKTIQHWKREITKLKLEDIPGEEKADLKQFSPEELNECDMDQAKMELNVMEENLATKRPDLKAIEEFKRKEAVYLERVSELDEITQKRDRARKRHDDLRKTRLNDFMAGFGTITAKLKEMYQVCVVWFTVGQTFLKKSLGKKTCELKLGKRPSINYSGGRGICQKYR